MIVTRNTGSISTSFSKEARINSETTGLSPKFVKVKAWIAGNSGTIGEIRNTELNEFWPKATFHGLTRGLLDTPGSDVK